ncbi:putative uncharacterized protein DDB_G0277255, partial [Diaphorina citri]|uniref:Uncharacterized protein n=1 Tax=Diaphorina citri TaxID=121845 RepID=A0A3Q0J772_DIACI
MNEFGIERKMEFVDEKYEESSEARDALNREKFLVPTKIRAIKKTGGEDSSIPGDSQQLGPPMDGTPETNPLYMNGNSVYSGSDEAKYNGATNNNNNENIKQDGGEEYVEMTINEIINGKVRDNNNDNEIINGKVRDNNNDNEIINGKVRDNSNDNEIINGKVRDKSNDNEIINGKVRDKSSNR